MVVRELRQREYVECVEGKYSQTRGPEQTLTLWGQHSWVAARGGVWGLGTWVRGVRGAAFP